MVSTRAFAAAQSTLSLERGVLQRQKQAPKKCIQQLTPTSLLRPPKLPSLILLPGRMQKLFLNMIATLANQISKPMEEDTFQCLILKLKN
ncbi:hypothetical protein DSO57_1009472 [Entomophthora muscae]|uniref:Uncharacterized protein n=1 Tax=Entomophthora muscae TaxID=34485 RepID=A0ACC2UGA4_9FUNG|nr:hypothetical protein DSO57_1009472 [Entomophthora muscae]